ncbi:MAG: exodeoxyribonuclease VII small subunit [bacterium]|nr:exodeoxyribonuclease VII small subunit [bacterium]
MANKTETLKAENPETMTFEQAIARLEELARLLEDGEIPIEQSLTAYEEGQKLFQFCQSKLQDAEKKLRKLDDLIPAGE